MLLRKLWRTMGTYKAQFISMIIMIALGIGIFIGFNIEWYSLEKNSDSFLRETNFADYRIVSESGFSADDVQNVLSVDGVKASSRFISECRRQGEGRRLVALTAENPDVSSFITVDGDGYDPTVRTGSGLKKYADANGIAVGDTLTFVYRNAEITGKVRGLIRAGEYLICVRDETQLMPDPDTYGFAYISPAMMKDALGFEFYPQINVISDTEKKDFCERIDSAFGKTMLILSKDENISYSGASGEAEEGKTMSTVLPVMFLLIAVLTMVTTMHRLAAKEKTQIGTLKALGFKNRRILAHYTSYALMIGLVGSAFGIAFGFGVAYFIMNPNGSMGTYLDMPSWKLSLPWFCWIVLVGIIALLTVIGFLSVRKMLAGCAADSLARIPQKVKPLRIEKRRFSTASVSASAEPARHHAS
ncbi:MAG: ABC transporter permease [Lachnospiraceae bacterium]